MKLYQHVILLICVMCLSAAAGCGKTPLLTELTTNKLLVVIKGTYESNSPQPWVKPSPDTTGVGGVQDNSVINALAPGSDAYPTVFMLDIAELQLLDMKGDKHKFSDLRQTFALPLDDGDPYFSGLGQILQNDDVASKNYLAVSILVRKMLFDNAKKYLATATSWSPIPFWDVFSENAVPAYNFNQLQTHAYYDTLRLESYLLNRVFPIIVPISGPVGMMFNDKFPFMVLEIRFVVKNFIKKYELLHTDPTSSGYVHYYAFSDWLHDVQADETVIGGNLFAVARWYIPTLTGSISGSVTGINRQVIAIPSDSNIDNYTIPPGNPRANNPCNLPLPPGGYLGKEINAQLDSLLKNEKWKYAWNLKFPAVAYPPTPQCDSITTYTTEWDNFATLVGDFKIPELAVYTPGGSFSIENVPAGSYNLYSAPVAPYGSLYYQGDFTACSGNPRNVGIGQAVTGVSCP